LFEKIALYPWWLLAAIAPYMAFLRKNVPDLTRGDIQPLRRQSSGMKTAAEKHHPL
jgi:hypothetical protein